MRRLGIVAMVWLALGSVAWAGNTGAAKANAAANRGPSAASSSTSGGATNAAAPAGREQNVEGRVQLLDRDNEMMLSGTEAVGRAFDKLKLDDATRVTVNGQQGTIADVNEGQDVRASFSPKDGELHVDRIEILSPGGATTSHAPSSAAPGGAPNKP